MDQTHTSRSIFGKAPGIPTSVFDDKTKRQFSFNKLSIEESEQPQSDYYDLNDKHVELPIDKESDGIYTSDNLTIIPVELSSRCSNFHNSKFQTVEPFYAMTIDGLKRSTTNIDLLQLILNQIPIDSIKWIIPTSFLLSTQMEYMIGTTLRIESFDSRSINQLRAPFKSCS